MSSHGGERRTGGGVLQPRRVAALDVLEDGLQRAAGHAPPSAPPFGVEPSGGHDAVGGLELLGVAAAEVGLPERAVGDVPWPLPRRTRQGRADACDLRTPRRAGGYRGHRHAAGADPPRPGHPHVRRDRVLGLEKEASLVLVQMTAPESVRRRAVAWETLGHAFSTGDGERRKGGEMSASSVDDRGESLRRACSRLL